MLKMRRSGFTLIELLVVVAIIALLLSILLPSLAGAREQGKRAVCLSNLNNIGKSLWQYAGEDSKESAVPVARTMRAKNLDYWLWRHAMWFSWGGRSGDQGYRMGVDVLLDDPEPGEPPTGFDVTAPLFAAKYRPLTLFITGGNINRQDRKKLDVFRCPSDTGYPDDQGVDDAPPENAERPMISTVGNSYRGSFASVQSEGGQGAFPTQGHFALGPWGHKLSSIGDTGRTVWFGEPAWFNMIGKDDGSQPDPSEEDLFGWHKRKLVDNLLFVDGSARSTKAEREIKFDQDTLARMNVGVAGFLGRYGDVRLDLYPVGGARIFGSIQSFASYFGRWPFNNWQDNYGEIEGETTDGFAGAEGLP